MGSWGPGVFDNDDALAWVGDIEDEQRIAALESAFAAVEGTQDRDGPACQEALAAAEVVAAMRGRPGQGLPAAAAAYAGRLGDASADLITRARSVVAAIFERSDLREAWMADDDADEWEDAIGDLLDRLEPAGGVPML